MSVTPRYSNNNDNNNNKNSQPGYSLVLNHITHHLAPMLFTPPALPLRVLCRT